MLLMQQQELSGGGFDPDYQAVLDYASANAISHPSSPIKEAQNNLMIALKADGLFAKMDVFHVFTDATTGNKDFKSICWKRLTSGTGHPSIIYTANGMITGDVPDAYFQTNYHFINDSINYTLNDAFYGNIIYSNDSLFMCASNFGTQNSFVYAGAQKRINSNNNNLNSSVDLSTDTGFIGISRYDSTNVSVFSKSTKYDRTQNSLSLPNGNYNIGYYNKGAYASTFAASIAGASLDATDIANFRNAFNTYLDALGLTQFA